MKSIVRISSYFVVVCWAAVITAVVPYYAEAAEAQPVAIAEPVPPVMVSDHSSEPVSSSVAFGSLRTTGVETYFKPDEFIQFAQAGGVDDANDPLEPVNRFVFGFNELFLQYIVRPIASLYKDNLPQPVQKAVNNVLANLTSPVVFANDLLQGRPDLAMETFGRFMVNSTAGMGGIRDVGEDLGWSRQQEDFGQTLGVWGVGEGFYLVIPIFGPSNPRDAVGKFLVDSYFDAFNLWADNTNRDYLIYTRMGAEGIDTYAGVMDELDEIRKTSIDYYAAIRSMYRQRRDSLIRNGAPGDLPPIPDISYDLPPEGAAP